MVRDATAQKLTGLDLAVHLARLDAAEREEDQGRSGCTIARVGPWTEFDVAEALGSTWAWRASPRTGPALRVQWKRWKRGRWAQPSLPPVDPPTEAAAPHHTPCSPGRKRNTSAPAGLQNVPQPIIRRLAGRCSLASCRLQPGILPSRCNTRSRSRRFSRRLPSTRSALDGWG
jgi:hypothetical protein